MNAPVTAAIDNDWYCGTNRTNYTDSTVHIQLTAEQSGVPGKS